MLVLRHSPGYRDEASVFFGGERKEKKADPPLPDPKTKGKKGKKGKTAKKGKNAKGEKAKPAPDPRQYAAFMTKALNAQEHGAKGMLLVSPRPSSFPDQNGYTHSGLQRFDPVTSSPMWGQQRIEP